MICFCCVAQSVNFASLFAFLTAGSSIAIMIAMIVMATSISIRVNARRMSGLLLSLMIHPCVFVQNKSEMVVLGIMGPRSKLFYPSLPHDGSTTHGYQYNVLTAECRIQMKS